MLIATWDNTLGHTGDQAGAKAGIFCGLCTQSPHPLGVCKDTPRSAAVWSPPEMGFEGLHPKFSNDDTPKIAIKSIEFNLTEWRCQSIRKADVLAAPRYGLRKARGEGTILIKTGSEETHTARHYPRSGERWAGSQDVHLNCRRDIPRFIFWDTINPFLFFKKSLLLFLQKKIFQDHPQCGCITHKGGC